MKTFSATDARNKFGDFLDTGMIEGVRVVRNNRVLGYFVPEREYERLKHVAEGTGHRPPASQAKALSPAQMETLVLYSQAKITSTEAKVDLGCDRRGLITLIAQNGLLLPRTDRARADEMARVALDFITPRNAEHPQDGAAVGTRDHLRG